MLWKKEFFDKMIGRFPEQFKNNSVTLTSLGFTNNFKPVEFGPSSETTISIFKRPSECYTATPCDASDIRVVAGENFIKCECFKASRPDFFGDSLKILVIFF